MSRLIYLTGFGPFPGIDLNPSASVAELLDGTRVGPLTVRSEVLPCSFARAPAAVRRSIARLQPALIVHLGLSLLDTVIRVESWAANEIAARIEDADGVQPVDVTIIEGEDAQPEIYETSLETAPVVEALRAAGFRARMSQNAGRYVCNCVYYSTLDHLSRNESSTPALFVHLPAPGVRPFSEATEPTWDSARLADAVRVVLEALLEQLPG